MKLPAAPLAYLITKGEATDQNFCQVRAALLSAIKVAVETGISFVQLREKALSTRLLAQLAAEAVDIASGSNTRILINDRADVAAAVRANGVHLTTRSLPVGLVRRHFPGLMIAASTHTSQEVASAARGGADFVVFGPVFASPGKSSPKGLAELGDVCRLFPDLPIVGLGGIDGTNFMQVLEAGAAGIAAIRWLNSGSSMRELSRRVNENDRSR